MKSQNSAVRRMMGFIHDSKKWEMIKYLNRKKSIRRRSRILRTMSLTHRVLETTVLFSYGRKTGKLSDIHFRHNLASNDIALDFFHISI
jgi:hypothetical protein